MHARAVSVKQSNDFNVEVVLAVVVKEQSLGGPLSLVVTGTGADWIYVAPVVLSLWVDKRVAIDL